MKAIMLAAGRGSRLSENDYSYKPKSLLEFGGRSLIERHVDILKSLGVNELVLVVGYRKDDLLDALDKKGLMDFIRPLHNPFFHEGAVVSLWTSREDMKSGDDILFMDADVLYHPDMLKTLIDSPHKNCFLMDQHLEPGDEPVKICIRDGIIADFGKIVEGTFDTMGEWPGFLKLSPDMAGIIADKCQEFIDRNLAIQPYEPAFKEVIMAHPAGTFGFEDVTGTPWAEIDFQEDLERAQSEILPKLPS